MGIRSTITTRSHIRLSLAALYVASLAFFVAGLAGATASWASTWSLQSTLDPEALPPESQLNAVSCPTTTSCAAFGYDYSREKELFRLWNGSEWKVGSSEAPNVIPVDTSCATTINCMVVGMTPTEVVSAEVWSAPAEGKPWASVSLTVPKPTGSLETRLSSVSCTSASACTAAGYYIEKTGRYMTLAERWNGSSWSIQTTANPASGNTELLGVSCTSASACTAVGSQASGTFVERWNGSTWSIQSSPNPEGTSITLSDVSCPTSSFCLATGSYGSTKKTLVERWNGSTWTLVSSSSPSETGGSNLTDVSCSSAEFCAAAGYYNPGGSERRTLVEHWNGSAVSLQSSPNPEGKTFVQLNDVSCTTSSACTGVGYSRTTLPASGTLGERWNGSTWSIQSTADPEPLPPESRLNAVSCPTGTSCAAFGYDYSREKELFRLWNGSEWQVGSSSTPAVLPADTSCATTINCMVVGAASSESVRAETWSAPGEGKTWSHTTLGVPLPSGSSHVAFNSVSCTSTTACTAAGSYTDKTGRTVTLAERWNGSEWTIQTTANPASGNTELLGVSCTSASACTAVGQQASGTFAERWNGSTWSISSTPNPTGTSIKLSDVSCPMSIFCLAVGSYSTSPTKTLVERWNGSAWTVVSSPNPSGGGSAYLTDVSCPAAESCTAAGYYATTLGGSENRTLVEGSNGTTAWLEGSVNPEGKALARLSDSSCGTPSACTGVGFSQATTAGPASGTLGEAFYEVDHTPPVIALFEGPLGVINYSNPTFSFESNEARSTFECSLDNASYTPCSSPKSYEKLSDGSHTFVVRATDVSGNLGKDGAWERSFQVDTAAPQTTISSPTPSYTAHEEWPITFSSSEAESTFECRLDLAKYFTPCSSPYTLPKGLSEGWHTFEVRATDKAKNTDATPATWHFNQAIYPSTAKDNTLTSPSEGAKSASHFTLGAKWNWGYKIDSIAYQLKLPSWDAFKYIPTKYLQDEAGNHPGAQIPVEGSLGKSPAIVFDLKAYAEA
ncbi:MAG TPA: hypothetical protein VFD73_25180, partial [Gemmatimonadales bacterium]|nr:hypothetical protein [Gemmatimonadales bacterium]